MYANTLINHKAEQTKVSQAELQKLEAKNYGGCTFYLDGCECPMCEKAWELQVKVNKLQVKKLN